MQHGYSERIRQRAVEGWLKPALAQGTDRFSIRVKDIMSELEKEDFPKHHQAQFCSALRTRSFLSEHGLEIERTDGPKSKVSTTVVFHYRIRRRGLAPGKHTQPGALSAATVMESPAERAKRVTDGLRGLLKKEIAAYGGTEAFIRWIRSEEDEAA